MGEPAFSVVMAAHNASRRISDPIRAVLAQSRPDLELIVVDDGSSDRTADVAESVASDPRIRVMREPHQGVAGARNAGIARARGRYISFRDSDDLMMPNHLEVVGRVLDSDPEVGIAYADGWVLHEQTWRIKRNTAMGAYQPKRFPQTPEDTLRLLVRENFITGDATVRQAALSKVGALNPSLTHGEDFELWLRIVAGGYRVARAPGLLSLIRDRPDQASKDHAALLRGVREVRRLVAEEYQVSEEIRGLARREMEKLDRQIAAVTGERPVRAALYRLRRRLGPLRRRLLPFAYEQPPREVRAAFPDLFGSGAGS